MDVFDTIFNRHSLGKVLPDPIPQEMIEKLLAAAVQAPNHHRVRPWRFIVLTGNARARLGDVMMQSLKQRSPDTPEAALESERKKPLRAPVIIAIGVDKPTEEKVVEIENICACAAAAQNILLAAHASGLGAIWRTGPSALDPEVKSFLHLDVDQELIGFLYIGYPQLANELPARPSFEDRTTWLAA
jgi:nitroreductase